MGIFEKRKKGYGENLYRNPDKGKIGGVCAGLAEHFDLEPTIVRFLFIVFLIFTFTAAFWCYILLWVVLARKPMDAEEEYVYDEEARCYRKKKLFKYQSSSADRLNTVQARMADIEKRIVSIERYVTSRKYDLNKAFSEL